MKLLFYVNFCCCCPEYKFYLKIFLTALWLTMISVQHAHIYTILYNYSDLSINFI